MQNAEVLQAKLKKLISVNYFPQKNNPRQVLLTSLILYGKKSEHHYSDYLYDSEWVMKHGAKQLTSARPIDHRFHVHRRQQQRQWQVYR